MKIDDYLSWGGVHGCEVSKPLWELLIDATHRLGKGNTRVTKGILSHKTKKKIGMLNTFKTKRKRDASYACKSTLEDVSYL